MAAGSQHPGCWHSSKQHCQGQGSTPRFIPTKQCPQQCTLPHKMLQQSLYALNPFNCLTLRPVQETRYRLLRHNHKCSLHFFFQIETSTRQLSSILTPISSAFMELHLTSSSFLGRDLSKSARNSHFCITAFIDRYMVGSPACFSHV